MQTLSQHQLIIASTPRCGSTFLGRALAGTKLVGTPEEWFQNSNMAECKRFYDLPSDIPNHLLRSKIMEKESNTQGWFSIKIMWETFACILDYMRLFPENKGKSDRELMLTLFPNPKFVWMRRENKLSQAVSYAKATQTGIWEYRGEKREYDDDLLSFDYLAIESARQMLSENELKWQRFLDDNGFDYLTISYEELLKDYENTLLRILRHCGFEEAELPDIAQNEMRRMSDKVNQEWRRRYGEVHGETDGTEVNDAPPPSQYSLQIEPPDNVIETGQRFPLKAVLTNTSTEAMNARGNSAGLSWVTLRACWRTKNDSERHWDLARGYPPATLAPGDRTSIDIIPTAPSLPGDYQLELFLALESRGEIATSGTPAACLPMEVVLPESAAKSKAYFGDDLVAEIGGWKWLPWFGYFYDLLFPWICHDKLGWLLCSGTGIEKDEYILSQSELGWMRTSSRDFPRLYSDDRKAYIEYECPSTRPCRFRVVDTDEIIEIEPVFE